MSLNEIIAIPEDDSWHYITNQAKPAFTPATFVTAALKQLGVFHDLEVNAAEFTVRDVYQLDIYDKNQDRPSICKEADYRIDFCQLFGRYRLVLPGYSTVPPYSHMNEKCPNPFENSHAPLLC